MKWNWKLAAFCALALALILAACLLDSMSRAHHYQVMVTDRVQP